MPTEVVMRVVVLVLVVALVVAVAVYLFTKLRKLPRKYMSATKDALLAIKIIITYLQINLSIPGMISNFEFPPNYQEFMSTLSFVNVDFISVLGVQCVVQVDFRYSMLVSLMFPTVIVCGTILAYLYNWAKLGARVAHFGTAQKKKALEKIFEIGDMDESGVIDNVEFVRLVQMLQKTHGQRKATKKRNSLNGKQKKKRNKKTDYQQWNALMLDMGGYQVKTSPADNYGFNKAQVTIDRDAFVSALLVAEELEHRTDSVRIGLKNTPHPHTTNHVSHIGQLISMKHSILWIKHNQLASFCASTCTQLLLLLHAPVSAKGFHYFDCHSLGTTSLLRRDYR